MRWEGMRWSSSSSPNDLFSLLLCSWRFFLAAFPWLDLRCLMRFLLCFLVMLLMPTTEAAKGSHQFSSLLQTLQLHAFLSHLFFFSWKVISRQEREWEERERREGQRTWTTRYNTKKKEQRVNKKKSEGTQGESQDFSSSAETTETSPFMNSLQSKEQSNSNKKKDKWLCLRLKWQGLNLCNSRECNKRRRWRGQRQEWGRQTRRQEELLEEQTERKDSSGNILSKENQEATLVVRKVSIWRREREGPKNVIKTRKVSLKQKEVTRRKKSRQKDL